jgi:hypothetical protein
MALNFDYTNLIQKKSSLLTIKLVFIWQQNYSKTVITGKFLGLHIDNANYSVQQALPSGVIRENRHLQIALLYILALSFYYILQSMLLGKSFQHQKDQMNGRCQEKNLL